MLEDKKIAEYLEKYKGNISATAKHLGVVRKTIYNRIAKSEELKAVLHDSRESMLDALETTLYDIALGGNVTALIFALKTQGRARGYGDQFKVETWHDEILNLIKSGKVTEEEVIEELGNELATELFATANLRED